MFALVSCPLPLNLTHSACEPVQQARRRWHAVFLSHLQFHQAFPESHLSMPGISKTHFVALMGAELLSHNPTVRESAATYAASNLPEPALLMCLQSCSGRRYGRGCYTTLVFSALIGLAWWIAAGVVTTGRRMRASRLSTQQRRNQSWTPPLPDLKCTLWTALGHPLCVCCSCQT